MPDHPQTRLKIIMNYGALAGLSIIVFSVIFYFIKIPVVLSILEYLVMIAAIVMGTKNFRDHALGGFISYGNALITGTLIIFFCGILSAFYNYVFNSFIDPGQFNLYLEEMIEQMEKSGTPDEQVEMIVGWMTPLTAALLEVIGYTIMGFIFSLIIAIFIRKTDDSFEAQVNQ